MTLPIYDKFHETVINSTFSLKSVSVWQSFHTLISFSSFFYNRLNKHVFFTVGLVKQITVFPVTQILLFRPALS